MACINYEPWLIYQTLNGYIQICLPVKYHYINGNGANYLYRSGRQHNVILLDLLLYEAVIVMNTPVSYKIKPLQSALGYSTLHSGSSTHVYWL